MKKVMIVDDSLELGRLLQASLMVMDPSLKVVVVPSAEEAILESSRNPMDLLITDIRLPGMSGMDLVRKIRVRRPVVKVMLITGLSDTHLDQQVKELAVDAFFRKPLEIPEFLQAARTCLGLEAEGAKESPVEVPAQPSPEPARSKKKKEVPQEEEELPDLLDMTLVKPPLETLSGALTELRHRLGALATLVLDERGHVLAQAGEPPNGGIMEKLASAWMGVHSLSLPLGALIKSGLPQAVQAFRGERMDVLFAPVGAFSLVVVLPVGKSALRLALAFETVLDELPELAEILGADSVQPTSILQPQLGVENAAEALPSFLEEAEAPHEEPPMGEFISALENKSPVAAEADSFWDTSDVPPLIVSTPDMLTYDQALQLGLTPEDKEK